LRLLGEVFLFGTAMAEFSLELQALEARGGAFDATEQGAEVNRNPYPMQERT